MRNKLIEHKLNDRWAVSSDRWNWILLDYQNAKKPIMSFHANLKQLSNALLDLKKGLILWLKKISPIYRKPPPTIPSIKFVIINYGRQSDH